MKQKVMIGIIAAVITAAGVGGLFALSKHQERAQNNQMEQRETAAYQPIETQTVKEADTSLQASKDVDEPQKALSTNADMTNPGLNDGSANISLDDIQIIFTGEEDSEATVTKEQAVQAAMDEISKRSLPIEEISDVNLSYYSSSLGKYYKGSVIINELTRYEFKVNALSKSIYDLYGYERPDADSVVWVRSEKDQGYVNKIISESDMKQFSKISVDFENNVDCQIVAGETYSVEADFYGYNYSIGMRNEDGMLVLRSEVNSKENGDRTSTVTITVPKDQILDMIAYGSSCGGLTLDGIQAKKGDITLYCGGIEIENSTIDVCNPVLYCGGLEFNDFLCNSCSAELYCGGAEINSWKQGTLTIDLSCGGLEIEQMSKGMIDARLSCGSSEIKCTGSESEYNYELCASLGENQAGSWRSVNDIKKDNHADATIKVFNSLGGNIISFDKN